MIHTNRWRPDTCECVIEYQWDDSLPEKERTHKVVKIANACEKHKKIKGKQKQYEAITEDNIAKNKINA